MTMSACGLVRYNKAKGTFSVPADARHEEPPAAVFVSNKTPYGNQVWLRRVLQECEGSICWFDKHFMPAALEVVWDAADAARVHDVRIMSLGLPDNSTKRARRDYARLKAELANAGIALEWRFVDSVHLRPAHDRWIVGDNSARNVPNVNAILSGQQSEMLATDNREELSELFEEYWALGVEMDGREATTS